MTITDIIDPGFYFFDGTTAILPKEEVEKGNFANNPVGLGPFKFKEHIPGSRVVLERFDKFYKPGKPYADRSSCVLMAEAAGARRRLPQQGDRHLDPRARRSTSPIAPIRRSRRASSRSPRCSRARCA